MLLSMLGFLSWWLSLANLSHSGLSAVDQLYLRQLRLDERPKVGGVFDLTKNAHEINFAHLANNGVGFHYIWTAAQGASLLRKSARTFHMKQFCILSTNIPAPV
jgi:hypothetical protein